jgi:hypothetical protein
MYGLSVIAPGLSTAATTPAPAQSPAVQEQEAMIASLSQSSPTSTNQFLDSVIPSLAAEGQVQAQNGAQASLLDQYQASAVASIDTLLGNMAPQGFLGIDELA